MKKFNIYQNGSKIQTKTIKQLKELGPDKLISNIIQLKLGESYIVSLKPYIDWEYERVL